MTDSEGVEFTFTPVRKGGQAAGLAHGQHSFATSCQNLVGVGLMPHIPDQPVFGCIEDVVQRNGEFHNAQPCAEVPSSLAH